MKIILISLLLLFSTSTFAWKETLEKEIKKIDQRFEGDLGLVIKNLKDGSILEYNADKSWYLSSTIKVLVAISLMEDVDKGKINLNHKITLREKDFVDGAGPLIWSEPGEQFSIGFVLKSMLRESDNTAADILIGIIGTDELNRDIKKWMPHTGTVTSLLDVRYMAYGELHPKARTLTNMDFIQFKNLPLEKRPYAFAEKVKIPYKNLYTTDLEEAFEKYYRQGQNSAKLQEYVNLLERLENQQLLTKKSTDLILTHMEKMKTGGHRIKAGLPADYKFIQKTGTQINRACNVGLVSKKSEKKSLIALAVCTETSSHKINTDKVFDQIGRALSITFDFI
ncbi:serine hydrolase [Peredibacter sp. HCB2-198]|uniref:serine hydrolase n=1 Tax=Peredibacter sp. HCB2-198 TaxID=3383025 RepID=UPI0038B523AB